MEPLRKLLDGKLYVGSQRFELHQKASAAAPGGDHGADAPFPREFAGTIAAKNALEAKFFACLAELQDPALWTCITNRTEATAARAFILVSRAGCMVEQLLATPHRLGLHKYFLILHQPELGPQLASEPKCMIHPAFESLVTLYGQELGNRESRMQLLLILILTRTDISHLESLHAWIRRLLHSRCQTHGMSLADASANWVLRRHTRSVELCEPVKRNVRTAKLLPDGAEPATKRRNTGGHENSWNLFCRQGPYEAS
jgi:hypothetical protein